MNAFCLTFGNHCFNSYNLISRALIKRLSTLTVLILLLFGSPRIQAQDYPEYEDILVFLSIQNVGGYEIDAIYMDDKIYIDPATLFRILKINHTSSNDSISGFFLKEENRYYISARSSTALVGSTDYTIDSGDIYYTATGMYLRNTLFGRLFDLNLNFNFRNLSLELKTSHELPIIKELRQEQMRKNINQLGGVVEVDTTYARRYHLLRGGMVDWSVVSSQTTDKSSDTRAALAIGTELLGGEFTGLLNYSTLTGFEERQQQYKWRWVNNDITLVKQIHAGKIPTRAVSSLYAPFIGVSASNTPTTFRKSFGSYVISDYTEPGWTVELYINNVIVDYTTADASGFFRFDVPMVYGTTQITMKFYGPWGEERIKEQTITVPYNFLPAGTVEYNVTGGILTDTTNGIFSRAEALAGINRRFTMGGGVEFYSALKENPAMPFITASARLFENLMIKAEYTHGVKAQGLLSYRLPSSLSFELDYTKYEPGQKAISFNYLEERKASLSVPLSFGKVRSFARLTYRNTVLPLTSYSNAEVLFSSYINGMSANISAYANWLPEVDPYIYSNVALGFRIGRSIQFRPQGQFDITNSRLISLKAGLEKNFSQKAYLTLFYERNVQSKTSNVEVAFRFDLPFAQTSASVRKAEKNITTTQSARGSLAFGSGNGKILANQRSSVGRGGITITPFLDLNNNSVKEKDEPIVTGLAVRLNGGSIVEKGDSLIRITELEPYTSYFLEMTDVGFENIAWHLKQKAISIKIDPAQFKVIDIPITVMGEVNGMVYVKKGKSLFGQSRIIINILDENGTQVHRILSESDGYYNLLGLEPGNYTAKPDTAQLRRLGMTVEPSQVDFTITPSVWGDIIDDVNFILSLQNPEPETGSQKSDINLKDNTPEQKEEGAIPPGDWYIQAGAFKNQEYAKALLLNINRLGFEGKILKNGVWYRVRINGFQNKLEARKAARILFSHGIDNFINK